MLLLSVIVFSSILQFGAARPRAGRLVLPRGPDSYIVGGQNASRDQWPSQLSIEYLGSTGYVHQCGAVLYNDRYALTAAHCVDGIQFYNLRVWAGVLDRNNIALTDGQLLLLSANPTLHPDYKPLVDGVPNNLAVVTLSTPANTAQSNIKNALLPLDDSNLYVHGGCFVSGYGRTISNNPMLASVLQWRQITGITNTECQERLANIQYADVLETHFCVFSDPPGSGVCNGDAGGPVYCYPSESETDESELRVVGIVSWFATVAAGCNLQYPQGSSRLSKYIDWIAEVTP